MLVDANLGTLELDPAAGYAVSKLDLGYPEARAATVARVNAPGADDFTAYYGARAVSLEITVWPTEERSAGAALDLLRAFTSPQRRPYLYLDRSEVDVGWDLYPSSYGDNGYGDQVSDRRRLLLRGETMSAPVETRGMVRVQCQWVAPEGVLEGEAEASALVPSEGTEAGRQYQRTYPLVYAETPVIGSVVVTNIGGEPAAPVIRFHGPVTDPALHNLTTGEVVRFSGLTLVAGQWVDVDVKRATVRINSDPNQSAYGLLDLVDSTLWWLPAGQSTLRFTAGSREPGSYSEITWRPVWL